MPTNENAAALAGAHGVSSKTHLVRGILSGAEVLAQRLDRCRRYGEGYRARCPACDDKRDALSFRDGDKALLLHCFRGCEPEAVLGAVGLRWADVQPPRGWPRSAEEDRQHRKLMREIGWAAALETVAFESKIITIAAKELTRKWTLSAAEIDRLDAAVARVNGAAELLCKAAAWRPEVRA
jgi:hypothetical protein